jgi:hypothetical protein
VQVNEELKRREKEKNEEQKLHQAYRKQLQQRQQELLPPAPVLEEKPLMDIQTEQYLEIIDDREIESESFTQTDANRPPSPLFIPAKSGVDVSTQIEEDLFVFEHEVEPILEVIVGKTLEQSMLEVLQEEEIQALKHQQRLFEQQRNVALVDAQKLEAMEIRKFEEKERRIKQEKKMLQIEHQTKEKLASRTFAKSFLSNMETKVFNQLESQGFFFDVVRREVETDFMPWLMESVQANITKTKSSRQMVDDLIKLTVLRLMETKNKAKEERERAEEEIRRKLEEAEKEIDLEATMQITPDMIAQDQTPQDVQE